MEEVSREEMAKLLEKAKADMQAMLDKMTPEERAAAEIIAQKMMEADEAETQRIMDAAAKITAEQTSPDAPRFCKHCGAKAGSGKICEYCGMPL